MTSIAPMIITQDSNPTFVSSAKNVAVMTRNTRMAAIQAAVIQTPDPVNHAPIHARAINQLRHRRASTSARINITRIGQHRIAIDPMIATMPMPDSNEAPLLQHVDRHRIYWPVPKTHMNPRIHT